MLSGRLLKEGSPFLLLFHPMSPAPPELAASVLIALAKMHRLDLLLCLLKTPSIQRRRFALRM